MGRARKDSFNQPPIETYRKNIGKQDYKKSKSELKESKKRAQSKKTKAKTYREMATILGCLFAVVFAGYGLSYLLLTDNVPSLWGTKH
ncbi:triple QxxK/R motif-containing protein-like [Haemaphysalis longicornis]